MKILSGSVLIVDDNVVNRMLLQKLMERMGLVVTVVSNGQEAVDLLTLEKFDMVFLDIRMPGMDGIEVLEWIKSNEKAKNTIVIMISAIDDTHMILRCIKKGATDYIPKPFEEKIVQSRVYRALQQKATLSGSKATSTSCDARILIVDNEPLILALIEKRISETGCSFILCENGKDALEVLQKEHFDLVLLDIIMPDISGIEVLEKIRSNSVTSHIPVVMLSSLDDFKTVRKCMEMGADDYIAKPFDKLMLLSRIRPFLDLRATA